MSTRPEKIVAETSQKMSSDKQSDSESSDDCFVPGSLKREASKDIWKLKNVERKGNKLTPITNCSQPLEDLYLQSHETSTAAKTPNLIFMPQISEQTATPSAAHSNFAPKRDHKGQIKRQGPRILLDKYAMSKSAAVILPQVTGGVSFSFSKNCTENSVTCVVSIDKQVITAKQGKTDAEAQDNASEDALRLILIRKLYSESGSIPWMIYGDFAKYKMLRDWGLVGIQQPIPLEVPSQRKTARKSFPRKSSFDSI
ncbi:uncharacterized protein LOC117178147 isoform X2 [Belonocnema kinseyi]|uniref:uncharacterized protein LOC117178147 isoform X2 n=1 Tax=Belonocnema kinseyi TaxID=2817044 RepID=UPI00143D4829|nr:uncharacterized protein LOC117178147 isoform X2 [Belonocnema kinseyi]